MALGDYGTASDNTRRKLDIGDTVTYTSVAAPGAKTGKLTWEWHRRPTENRVRAFTVTSTDATPVVEILPESAFTFVS